MVTLDRSRLEQITKLRHQLTGLSPVERELYACYDIVQALMGFLRPFSVTLCGRHPHAEDFDDAHTGEEYATLEEARAIFDAPNPIEALSRGNADPERFISYYQGCTPYVWLLGPEDEVPGGEQIREMPGAQKMLKRLAADDGEWRREQAMQAGMAFGCQGYNEAMGYD